MSAQQQNGPRFSDALNIGGDRPDPPIRKVIR